MMARIKTGGMGGAGMWPTRSEGPTFSAPFDDPNEDLISREEADNLSGFLGKQRPGDKIWKFHPWKSGEPDRGSKPARPFVKPARPFVERMTRLWLTVELARTRVLTCVRSWPPGPPDRIWTVTVANPWEDGQTLTFQIVSLRQHFGGERWFWLCRACGRRCRMLLSPNPEAQFRCRQCSRAVYRDSDYRRRPTRRRLLRQASGLAPDLLEPLRLRLAELTAPRRKGVRRGRHVQRRTERLRARIQRQEQRVLQAREAIRLNARTKAIRTSYASE